MNKNPLLRLQAFGQSIWLDFLRRGLMTSGELRRLIEEDGIRGVTANPSIFEKAIEGSEDYDEAVRALARRGTTAHQIYEALAVEDVQRAADLFRAVYDETGGQDGFVSLEISPHLANDTAATIAEARRFWARLARSNLMIKVPATPAGIPAIRQLTREGVNINVTLLFSLDRYREVVEAYLAGMEARTAEGYSIDRIVSVASFFLSRIDVLIDPILEKLIPAGGLRGEIAMTLHGQVAIASAKMAYQIYKEAGSGDRFRDLAKRGARPQRFLWASTSPKNPAYRDVMYVDALIGPETINTLPLERIHAYRDHGRPASRLEERVDDARRILARLPEMGVDMEAVAHNWRRRGSRSSTPPSTRWRPRWKSGAALSSPSGPTGTFSISARTREAAGAGSSDRTSTSSPARLCRRDPSLRRSHRAERSTTTLSWRRAAHGSLSAAHRRRAPLAPVPNALLGRSGRPRRGGSSGAPHTQT